MSEEELIRLEQHYKEMIKIRFSDDEVDWDRLDDFLYRLLDTGKLEKLIKAARKFTGLKDKNGTEIYEGDIVQVEEITIIAGKKTNVKVNKVVKYKKDYGQFLLYQGDKKEHLTFATSGEVVGSIYENKHLIGG